MSEPRHLDRRLLDFRLPSRSGNGTGLRKWLGTPIDGSDKSIIVFLANNGRVIRVP